MVEIKIPPGSHSLSSLADTLTPEPMILSPSTITSSTCIPTRHSNFNSVIE